MHPSQLWLLSTRTLIFTLITHYILSMKSLTAYSLLIACCVAISFPSISSAQDNYYKRQGVSTYGVNNEKIECPNCGRTISKYDSHMCRKESSSSASHSSSRSSSGGTVTEADMRAVEAKYPDLQINNTSYTPVDYSQILEQSNDNSSDNNSFGPWSDNSSDQSSYGYEDNRSDQPSSGYADNNDDYSNQTYDSNTYATSHKSDFGNKFWSAICWIILLAAAWYIFKWILRKFRRRKVNKDPELSNESTMNPELTTTDNKVQLNAAVSEFGNKIREGQAKLTASVDRIINSKEAKEARTKVRDKVNRGSEILKTKLAELKESRNAASKSNTPPVQTPSVASLAEEIQKLNALRKSGAITEVEYEQLKSRIINN